MAEHSIWPSTTITSEMFVWSAIVEDHGQTIDDICTRSCMAHVSWLILSQELNTRRNAAELVSWPLSNEQKQHCVNVYSELKVLLQTKPDFLSQVITSDKFWVYGYDLETKQQSSWWKSLSSPWARQAQQVKNNIKSLLICFFDSVGTILNKFIPPVQAINREFCHAI